ncbi:MAG TPA: hypothetical protein VIQ74_03790, partial [Gemmatimonadaceae bacterium]
MKLHSAILIALATSALACSRTKTSESTGEIAPEADTVSMPSGDTINTRTRDDTLNLPSDTSMIRDTTTGVYGDTTGLTSDTAAFPRDTTALPSDTMTMPRD